MLNCENKDNHLKINKIYKNMIKYIKISKYLRLKPELNKKKNI